MNLDTFDTEKVTDMSGIFEQCTSLSHLDLSHFITKNLTEIEGMFRSCNCLTDLDLSGFDVSSLKLNEDGHYGIQDLISSVHNLKKVKMPANLPEESMLPCENNACTWKSEYQNICKSAAAGLAVPMLYFRI